MENVKKPMEEGRMCTFDGECFIHSQKAHGLAIKVSCHITNDDTGFYNFKKINETVQGSLGNMSEVLHESMLIWWQWTGNCIMAQEVLHQRFCKSVFPNMTTMIISWCNLPIEILSYMLNWDSWQLGSQSQIPPRHWLQKSSNIQVLDQKRYWWPTQIWPSFKSHYMCNW